MMRCEERSNTIGAIEQWTAIGRQAIAEEEMVAEPLPWNFDGTVFRCAWEYPVRDFEAEVGFYIDVLGFTTIALDDEYALFTTADEDFTFACRRHPEASPDYSGHILCLMTKGIELISEAFEARMGDGNVARVAGSPVQAVLRVASPAGLQIDIWEMPS
jgi:catechol 2,3-dioxygenase-like lactoylglutathione lyase family enzyme